MENEFNKIPTLNQVQNTAVRLLARREHSQVELRQKLLQRGYPVELIQQALQKLVEKKLLSDERFVESYIRARSNKGYGPLRIINELQQRGINTDIIADFMDESASEWLLLAEQVRQKKFSKKIPKEFNEKAKQMRFLQYRGFTLEQINKVMAT